MPVINDNSRSWIYSNRIKIINYNIIYYYNICQTLWQYPIHISLKWWNKFLSTKLWKIINVTFTFNNGGFFHSIRIQTKLLNFCLYQKLRFYLKWIFNKSDFFHSLQTIFCYAFECLPALAMVVCFAASIQLVLMWLQTFVLFLLYYLYSCKNLNWSSTKKIAFGRQNVNTYYTNN